LRPREEGELAREGEKLFRSESPKINTESFVVVSPTAYLTSTEQPMRAYAEAFKPALITIARPDVEVPKKSGSDTHSVLTVSSLGLD
jgi:hypothetical protein